MKMLKVFSYQDNSQPDVPTDDIPPFLPIIEELLKEQDCSICYRIHLSCKSNKSWFKVGLDKTESKQCGWILEQAGEADNLSH